MHTEKCVTQIPLKWINYHIYIPIHRNVATQFDIFQCFEHFEWHRFWWSYGDFIISVIASQITSLTIVCLTVYSGADQRKHQSSASLAFVWGIHRWPVNSPHKGPVTRKLFPFDYVIMILGDRKCKWQRCISVQCNDSGTPKLHQNDIAIFIHLALFLPTINYTKYEIS